MKLPRIYPMPPDFPTPMRPPPEWASAEVLRDYRHNETLRYAEYTLKEAQWAVRAARTTMILQGCVCGFWLALIAMDHSRAWAVFHGFMMFISAASFGQAFTWEREGQNRLRSAYVGLSLARRYDDD